jgi:predicted lactoylglutathione lyase
MKPGAFVQFHISTNDVGGSVSFYKLMGFKELANGKKPFRWVAVSDGNLNIFLSEEEFYGLGYFDKNMEEKASEIEGQGIEYVNKDLHMGDIWYKVVKDPNNFFIGLIEDTPEYLLNVNKNKYEPKGIFKEIGIVSDKIKESVEFWKKFGFKIKNDSGKTSTSMRNGNMGIGLYKPGSSDHYFEGPALTFYDNNMPDIIRDLKDAGLDFQEEIKDNNGSLTGAVVLSPEGQTFFLFKE